MKIVVLAGGLSPERDVSLSSGALIANALMDNGHQVCLLDLYLGRTKEGPAEYQSRESGMRYRYEIPAEAPDLERLKETFGHGDCMIGTGVLETCQTADVVFMALHGAAGENGQIQAVFDAFGIRYTGSSYAGCLLAMDKDISKKIMVQAGIKTADWKVLHLGEGPYQVDAFPCVVKPCSCGSSIGVTIVEDQTELEAALKTAFLYESKVLVEAKIEGREFSVGILDGEALPAIEIIPVSGFFDYKNKYQAGAAKEICPAPLDEEAARKMAGTACRLHEELGLGYYSRVDFIMDAKGDIWCLEANTLPGMTPVSLLVQEAKAAGISYHELCEAIVNHIS